MGDASRDFRAVFANLRHNKQLNRFTLRWQASVWGNARECKIGGYVARAGASEFACHDARRHPWLHSDDRPDADRYALRFRTSLPASIEAFVRKQAPGAERI